MSVYIPKTQAQDPSTKAIGQAAQIIISFIVLMVFEKIISWFVKPLVSSVNPNAVKNMIENKQLARKAYLAEIEQDASDPMHQFQLRFLNEVEFYKNDPDTEVYKTWYTAWKNGQIIDSRLRWVPSVYKEDGETFNPKFLEYMKIQYGLHTQASFVERAKFSRTISKYFPEFSSNLTGLGQDIAQYSDVVAKEVLRDALAKELDKFDLPEDYVTYLKTLPIAEVKKALPYLKQCADLEYVAEAAVLAYEEGLEVKVEAKALHVICSLGGLPAYVGLAYIKEEITDEEVQELVAAKDSYKLMNGYSVYAVQPSGYTLYEELIDAKLAKFRANKRTACL
jgi:hypothetical protein